MNILDITPLILTFNEEPNIGRVLDRLSWAKEILVIDSGSHDRTVEICKGYSNVRVAVRTFDNHANQWNYGLNACGIDTDWVLALDADYLVTDEFREELQRLEINADMAGYRARFRYCVFGKPLRGSLYPPVTVLFRRSASQYVQDGHTQRIVVDGNTAELTARLLHDDRKPLADWLRAQNRYMDIEAEHIWRSNWGELSWPDRLRKLIVPSPVVVFFYCLLLRGGLMDGGAGLYYALQRALAEGILSLKMLERVMLR